MFHLFYFGQEIEAHFSKKSDMNLLRKGPPSKAIEKPPNPSTTNIIQLDNLQNLHVPISSQQQAKIIHLQQSDFAPVAEESSPSGATNHAYEESCNTTHL